MLAAAVTDRFDRAKNRVGAGRYSTLADSTKGRGLSAF